MSAPARRSTLAALLSVPLALSSAPALAGDELESMSLEELLNMSIETSSRRAQPFAWAPANAVVVTAQQIRARRYVNLKDLLQDLPGVNVYDNFSDQVRGLVAVRGVPGTQTFVILQNGRRLTSATGEALSIEDNYPLFQAKQVEVVFGPASALYGADALSGVINIITEEPTTPFGASASVAYGTDAYRYGSLLAHGKLLERLRLRVAGHYHDAQNPDLSRAYPDAFPMGELKNPFTGETVGTRPDNRFDNATASHSLNVEAKLDDSFTVGFDQRGFTHSSSAGVRPEYTLYGPQSQLQWQALYAEHRATLTERLTATSLIHYSGVRYLPDFGFNNFFSAYAPVYKRMESQAFSVHEQLAYTLSDAHHLSGGISWSSIHSSPTGSDLTKPVDPDRPAAEQGLFLPGTSLPVPMYEVAYRTLGGYLQFQSQWLPQLSTTVGVRYDMDSRFGGTFNPRLGAVYQPAPEHTLKLLYGEAFLAPSTYNQYTYYGAFTGTDEATGKPYSPYFHLPNPALKPMKARTVELNYIALLSRQLMLTASGYLGRTDNIITPVTTAQREEFAGGVVGVVERFQSIGRATQFGGTASLRLQESLGPVGVDVWASYTLSQGLSDDGPGTVSGPLPYNTPHTVKGGMTLEYAHLQLTPRVRFSGPATHASDPTQPGMRHTVPGAAIFDVGLYAPDVVGRLSLTLDVRNVLDTRSYAPGNLGAISFVQNPQDTRRVMLSASYAL